MKLLVLLFFTSIATAFNFKDDLCPDEMIKKCTSDVDNGKYSIMTAFDVCRKGASIGGTIDLDCIKYFTAGDKDCWPCICQIVKDKDLKVKGC